MELSFGRVIDVSSRGNVRSHLCTHVTVFPPQCIDDLVHTDTASVVMLRPLGYRTHADLCTAGTLATNTADEDPGARTTPDILISTSA